MIRKIPERYESTKFDEMYLSRTHITHMFHAV